MNYGKLFIGVLRDVFSDKTRKSISQQEVFAFCESLSRSVEQNYIPDLVVAIGNGGKIPGNLVSEYLHIPVEHIVIRRDIYIARRYGQDPIPLRWIMSLYHHFLFRTVQPTVVSHLQNSIQGKKVLIVDDAVDTGSTIDVTVLYLKEMNVLDIRTASLSYVSNRKPDYFVLPRGNYSFPWSVDHNNATKGLQSDV